MVLDLKGLANFCDYFVLISGTSLRQVNAFAEIIQDELVKDNIRLISKPPSGDQSGWVALDYSGVVAHIFYEPLREFYALERLWSDAKKVRITKQSNEPRKKRHSRSSPSANK